MDADPPFASPREGYRLFDPWARRGYLPLDGPLERTGASPTRSFVLGLFALAVAFILFQLVVSPLALLGLGVPLLEAAQDPDGMLLLIEENIRELILGNSVGQVLGLALPALLFARLHTTRLGAYLRLRRPDSTQLLLTLVGLAALIPVVQWLGAINQEVPLPEALEAMEASQMHVIEQVLEGDLGLWFSLGMLAVVPAVCEEVLFRGYAQRQFERGTGVVVGIVLSGAIFGLYHLRFTQLLPLTVLGLYIAYITWRTGSLWPAIAVHFANNAFSVIVAEQAAARPGLDVDTIETMGVPWYVVLPAMGLFVAISIVIHQRGAQLQADRQQTPSPPDGDASGGPSTPSSMDHGSSP